MYIRIFFVFFIFLITGLSGCGKKNLVLISDKETLNNLSPITFDKNDNTSPSSNKEGSKILFTSRENNLYNIFLKTTPYSSNSIQRTNFYSTDIQPCFSNSDNLFCYSSNRYGDFDIFIQNVNSGYSARRVTSTEDNDVLPSWSPDDKTIAFSRYNKSQDEWSIVIRVIESGSQKIIANGINPVFALDGNSIFFRKKDNKFFNLWKYDLVQNKETLIYQNDDWGLGRFQIDHTGTKIIFSNNKNSKYDYRNPESGIDLWVLNIENGETIQLTSNDSNDFDPVWLENGKIIFVSNRLGSNNIWQFDLQDF